MTMLNNKESWQVEDPILYTAIADEALRQEQHIELIASENYTSPGVMALQGSVLTNKYAEGYPGKRYYGGCEHVDVVEQLAIERAKELFSADYVNVQPHSGSQANAAVYMALLNPGDVLLGLDLSHGGHLTHGSSVNFSGKVYTSYTYGLNEQGDIDYDQLEQLAKQHKPNLIISGFSAFSGIIDWQRFRAVADSVNAYLLADIAHVSGLIAAGLYPSPVNIADVTTTTTHKTLRGPRGGLIMAKSNPDLEKRLNSAIFPGTQGGPLMHVIAGKALAFHEALQPEFIEYQKQVMLNAKAMAAVLKNRGYAIVSGDTSNHLLMINLIGCELTGKDAEAALGLANITVNKNTVPGDPRSPFVTSGIRIGSPAVTSRGMKQAEMELVSHWIADILDDWQNSEVIARVKEQVIALCQQFPVYEKSLSV